MLLITEAINIHGYEWEMVLLIPLGFLANTIPFTPGGLGVGEAAFDTLFVIAGFTGGAEILLGWRILLIFISNLGLFYYLQGSKRFVYDFSSKRQENIPLPDETR